MATRLPEDDDCFDRYVIRGTRRERPKQFRSRNESITFTRLFLAIYRWNEARSEPWGEVYLDVGYRLREEPLTAIGIPISYVSVAVAEDCSKDQMWIHGQPVLAVEFIDTRREPQWMVLERVGEYLSCGVSRVWVVDPDPQARTVQVFRLGELPMLLGPGDTLTGDPEMPGFSCPVAEFFR